MLVPVLDCETELPEFAAEAIVEFSFKPVWDDRAFEFNRLTFLPKSAFARNRSRSLRRF
jgi:hypothetical protein